MVRVARVCGARLPSFTLKAAVGNLSAETIPQINALFVGASKEGIP